MSPRQHGKISVKNSPIHGRGVFATALIREGETAVSWENTREITVAERETLSPAERVYVDIQDGKILLVGEPERFVNHACEANTRAGVQCDIAVRDIEIGEEVTADYSQYYISAGHFSCSCGAPGCRGIVRGKNATSS